MRTFLLGLLLTAFLVLPGSSGRRNAPEGHPVRPAPPAKLQEIDPEWGLPVELKADVMAGRC